MSLTVIAYQGFPNLTPGSTPMRWRRLIGNKPCGNGRQGQSWSIHKFEMPLEMTPAPAGDPELPEFLANPHGRSTKAERIVLFEEFAKLGVFLRKLDGGESGIRTHGRVSPTHAFQACSIDHSDISPFRIKHLRTARNSVTQNPPSIQRSSIRLGISSLQDTHQQLIARIV